MATLAFTPNLEKLVDCPEGAWPGTSVGEVLDAAFAERPGARGYVLDDQGAVRKHVMVFVNGEPLASRSDLSVPVGSDDAIFVMQALSGG